MYAACTVEQPLFSISDAWVSTGRICASCMGQHAMCTGGALAGHCRALGWLLTGTCLLSWPSGFCYTAHCKACDCWKPSGHLHYARCAFGGCETLWGLSLGPVAVSSLQACTRLVWHQQALASGSDGPREEEGYQCHARCCHGLALDPHSWCRPACCAWVQDNLA
jgi:hypothetical protein